MQEVTMAALAGAVLLTAASRFRPLLAVQRGVILLRAAGYLLGEMADGAWARRNRWRECEERVRREA